MDTITTLTRVIDETRRVVGNVQPDQLGQPTPCSEWDVRALYGDVDIDLHETQASRRLREIGGRRIGDVIRAERIRVERGHSEYLMVADRD